MNFGIARHLSAVIPAAGFSSRMKDFKPLLPFGNKTMIEQVIDLFKNRQIHDIIVVTGHNHHELDPVVENAGALPVFNPDFESGMLSSIQKGVKNTRPENTGFFLLPVDIPAIRPSTIDGLISMFHQEPGQILVPCFNKISGHPPLIPSRLKTDILNLSSGSTLRDLLLSEKKSFISVKTYDRGTLMDADDKKGYAAVLEKFLSRHIPDKEECLAIIDDMLPGEDAIRTHLVDVSFTALKIAISISDKLDPNLVIAAALLHDIKRKEKDHAKAGAKAMKLLGFGEVSEIIAQHMDIEIDHHSPIQEKEIVYFSDKICNEQGIDLNYHKRFKDCLKKSPWAMTSISKRYENTQLIQARIESSAGKSIKEILSG